MTTTATISETVNQIKAKIQKETGLRVSIRVEPTSSSMRGYIHFSTVRQKGEFTQWGYEYRNQLISEFDKPEPRTTYCNNYRLSIYFGNEAYNLKSK